MRRRRFLAALAALAAVATGGLTTARAQDRPVAEVLHWWISPGESAAVQVLRRAAESRGLVWVDTPMANSAQSKAATLSRLMAGKPPTCVQWHVGVELAQMHHQWLVRDLGGLSETSGWAQWLPPMVWSYLAPQGRPLAAPLNLHGCNWLFANQALLREAKMGTPRELGSLRMCLERLARRGCVPLVLGGQTWMLTHLFMSILLAVAGPETYTAILGDRNQRTLAGPELEEALARLIELRPFTGPAGNDLKWDQAVTLVAQGKAGMIVMGDWAKPEFSRQGLSLERDLACTLFPGSQRSLAVACDSLAMLRSADPGVSLAQRILAGVVMDPVVQMDFNRRKGSLPVRLDLEPVGLDASAREVRRRILRREVGLVPTLNMACDELTANLVEDELLAIWRQPKPNPHQAARRLARAIGQEYF